MRILVVHPGASSSTHDVFTGLKAGLQARGHQLWDYALDARIQRSGAWLTYCWKKAADAAKKAHEVQPDKPTPPDILYHAGEELVARTLRVQPDVVLVVSGMYLHPDILVLLRRAGVRVAIAFTESPYDDERQVRLLPWVDLAWTNERLSAVDGVRYLPHALNPEVHTQAVPLDESVPAHDVVFVGTGFIERVQLLEAVDWSGLDVGLYGSWELLAPRSRLRAFLRGHEVTNAMTAQLYRRARAGLNLFRTSKGFGRDVPHITQAESLNPRAYELAAAGCFHLSDYRAEVGEVFGDLVPTFDSPFAVRPLLNSWLADTDGRARVRAQLPAAVAAQTWHERARQIEEDLQGVGIGASHAAHEPKEPLAPAEACAGG